MDIYYFQSFDYLVEAKWRKDQPTEGEIGSFKHKVEGKFKGTRGLFMSVAGFRREVSGEIRRAWFKYHPNGRNGPHPCA